MMRVGDEIQVDGRTYAIIKAGDDYAHSEPNDLVLRPVVHMCAACGKNDAEYYDEGLPFCQTCVMDAARVLVIHDCIQHYLEDTGLAKVIADDFRKQHQAADSGQQYVDLHSVGWDEMRSVSYGEVMEVLNVYRDRIYSMIASGEYIPHIHP